MIQFRVEKLSDINTLVSFSNFKNMHDDIIIRPHDV